MPRIGCFPQMRGLLLLIFMHLTFNFWFLYESLNAYVSKYCCPQFAQQVEQILWDTQRFRTVTVDKQ
jgi:hypothetical protein